jgi:hypothetical protein
MERSANLAHTVHGPIEAVVGDRVHLDLELVVVTCMEVEAHSGDAHRSSGLEDDRGSASVVVAFAEEVVQEVERRMTVEDTDACSTADALVVMIAKEREARSRRVTKERGGGYVEGKVS